MSTLVETSRPTVASHDRHQDDGGQRDGPDAVGHLYIARDEVAAALDRIVTRPGTVATLLGAPGSGKSALLRRWRPQAPRWDVKQGSTPPAVRAGGPGEGPDLVVDEAHHDPDGVRHAIAALREVQPTLRVVVAGRRRLGIDGEQIVDLPPLSRVGEAAQPSQAHTLLLAQLRAVRDEEPPAHEILDEILCATDGLPGAIEAAARRCRLLSPAQVAARPDDGPLTGAFDQAWAALPRDTARALGWLAQFAGSFDLGDAAQLLAEVQAGSGPCSVDAGELEHLLSLAIDHAVLIRDDGPGPTPPATARYRLLAPYRRRARPAGADEAVQAAHTRVVLRDADLALDEGIPGPGSLRALRTRQPDLEAVVHRARHHGEADQLARAALLLVRLHLHDGPLTRAQALLRLLRAEAGGASPRLRARIAVMSSLVADKHQRGGEPDLDAALAAARRHGDAQLLAEVFHAAGVWHVSGGRCAQAIASFRAALSALEGRNRRMRGFVACRLAALLATELEGASPPPPPDRRGDGAPPDQAALQALLDGALDDFAACDDEYGEAIARNGLARLAQRAGDLDQAARHHRRIAVLAERVGSLDLAADTALKSGRLARLRNDVAAAHESVATAVALYHRLGHVHGLAVAHLEHAILHAHSGDTKAARAALDTAEHAVRRTGRKYLLLAVDAIAGLVELNASGADGLPAARRIFERTRKELERLRAEGQVPGVFVPETLDVLRASIEQHARSLPAPQPTVQLARDGSWFQPAGGDRIGLGRRHALRAIVALLATRHLLAPGTPVPLEEIVAAAWPGPPPRWDSAVNRVYVAVSTLRKLGLEAIAHRDDGYYLVGEATIRVVDP